jgi:hypothetical protein
VLVNDAIGVRRSRRLIQSVFGSKDVLTLRIPYDSENGSNGRRDADQLIIHRSSLVLNC